MHTLDVVLERPALLVAAQRVTAAVDVAKAGRMKPVLGCLKLTAPAAGHGHPTLTGTDQAGWATAELPVCDPPTPGECLLPADKLLDILRVCTGPDLRVTATADGVAVRVASARFEFPGTSDPIEFPGTSDAPDAAGTLMVDARRLAVALRRAMAVADGENRQYVVNGVCLDVAADGCLTVVGTDTKALAVSVVPTTACDDPPKPAVYLVPMRVARAVAGMAAVVPPDTDGQPVPMVGVKLWGRGAEFILTGLTIHTSLMEGRYPPYREVLRQFAPTHVIPVDPAVLGGLVRQAKITTAIDSRRVTLAFAPGRLEVTGEGQGAGSAAVTADLPGYDGPAVVEAFDPDYLLAFCREAVGDDRVTIGVPKRPGTGWTCDGGGGYLFLVVPLTG